MQKKKNGITLVALIITIIILLILAVVTISAVNEGNLFAHANNAATKYKGEAELENTKISSWLSKLEEIDGVEKNYLQRKGLTSPYVIFNTTYTCDDYTRVPGVTATIQITDDSVVLKEDSTVRMTYDEETLETAYQTLKAFNDSLTKEQVEMATFPVVSDCLCGTDLSEGTYSYALKFTDTGTINLYFLNDFAPWENIIDDANLIGTFTANAD